MAAFRVYSNDQAISITGFGVLSIQVISGTITLKSNDPQNPPTDFITLSADEDGISDVFTWPDAVAAWDVILISAGGSYQLYTNGQITLE